MAAETVTDRLIRIKRAIADADRARERALGELRASVTALLEALGDKTPVDSVLEDPAALDAFVKRAETEAGAARTEADKIQATVAAGLARTEERYGLA